MNEETDQFLKDENFNKLYESLRETHNPIKPKWNPANGKSVLEMLERVNKRKRIPKKRRYAKGSRKWGVIDGP